MNEGYYTSCHVCGKSVPQEMQWAYKRNINKKWVFYCSWRCLREHEKELDSTKAKKKLEVEEVKERKTDAAELKARRERAEARRKQRFAERLARGVCQICEAPLAEGHNFCPACLEYKRNQARKYHAQKRKEQ